MDVGFRGRLSNNAGDRCRELERIIVIQIDVNQFDRDPMAGLELAADAFA